MARKLPPQILLELKETVGKLADEHRYLERSQIDNTAFLDKLTQRPDVGGRIEEFMGRHEVRHYIKDAILKKYAKTKRQPPPDVLPFVKQLCAHEPHLVEEAEERIVGLYRCDDGHYVVVAKVAYRKWETGLRRALLYIARNEKLRALPRLQLRIGLLIMLHGSIITDADKRLIERALELVGVSCCWVA